jgi:hypothetical protein
MRVFERARRQAAGALAAAVAAVTGGGLAGCAPAAEGRVAIRVSAGEQAERGFPSHLLEDGWSVQFTRYLVSTGGFTLTSDATGEVRRSARHVVLDLNKGDGELGALEGLSAGRWQVGFDVSPPPEGAEAGPQVSAGDVRRMRERGWAYWLEGVAVKAPAGVLRFEMGFPVDARMARCTNGADGTLGVVVPENSTAQAEVTVHAEHMLYDRLGTHKGVKLRFEAFAAVAGEDRLITTDELATQDLLSLRGLDGGELVDPGKGPVVYQPGSYAVRTLLDFVSQSIVDQAHLNGGGICEVEAP